MLTHLFADAALGRQAVFANHVHWAKTYLAKAGLVESTRRGHFRITARGREILSAGHMRIDTNLLTQFAEYRQFVERGPDVAAPPAETAEQVAPALRQTPDEGMRLAHRQIEDALAQELLEANFFESPGRAGKWTSRTAGGRLDAQPGYARRA